jgi:hypothetical protein
MTTSSPEHPVCSWRAAKLAATTPRSLQACTVSINLPFNCICVGGTRQFFATGSPGGGTYNWSIVQGGDRASIVSGANQQTVTVRGNQPSSGNNDVVLAVTYQAPGSSSTCTESAPLSVVGATLTFRSVGVFDPLNEVPPDPASGTPQLGPVTPGNPPGCTGFFKNIEIEARITPNDPGLRCQFDFRQTRQGTVGLKLPDGTLMPGPLNCPVGPCDDDFGNADEDLTLSVAGTLYEIDTPGQGVNSLCTSGGPAESVIAINCLNLSTWLEMDGEQCGNTVNWHADTQIRCQGGNWTELSGSVGLGPIVCQGPFIRPSELDISTAFALLSFPKLPDRVGAFKLHRPTRVWRTQRVAT